MDPKIIDMMNFLAVVENKSFTAAAARLSKTKSAVSQSVTRLEEAYNCKLLNRTTRALTLTESGAILFSRCVDIQQSYDSARLDICIINKSPTGVLSITAPHALSESIIFPTIAQYTNLYPNMRVRLITSDLLLDPIEEKLDLSITIGRPSQNTLVISKLGVFSEGLFSGVGYLEKKGGIPNDLHQLKEWDHVANQWQGTPLRYKINNETNISVLPRIQCTSFNDVKELTLQNTGVSLLPYFSVLDALTSERIVLVAPIDTHSAYTAHRYLKRTPIKVSNFTSLLRINFALQKERCGLVFSNK